MREGSPVKAERLARVVDAGVLFDPCLDQWRDGPAVAERLGLERVLAGSLVETVVPQ